jgi:agmatine/peptidylarginine deiminase
MRYFLVHDGYKHYVSAESEYEAIAICSQQAGYNDTDTYLEEQNVTIDECDANDSLEIYDYDHGQRLTKTLSEWMGEESGIICSELT